MIGDDAYTRRMLQTVFTVAGVSLLGAALWEARDALMLIYVSALLAMGSSPLVRLIERARPDGSRRMPRWAAILIIYIAILAVFVLLGLAVVPPLLAQAEALWARMPDYFNRLQTFFIRHHLMAHRVTLQEAVQNAPSGASGSAMGTAFLAISSVIGGLFSLITVLILSFYLQLEAESIFAYWIRFVPQAHRGEVGTLSREAVAKVSAWLGAQFALAGVMGTFAALGLGFLGLPYFYVIALIAAIGETIPIVGPVIGGITAVAVAVAVSPGLAVVAGVYFLILHQLEANILVPKLMERRVGVSPVAVMAALLVGGALRGLMGAVLAIPTAAILSVVLAEIGAKRESLHSTAR